MQVVRHLAKGQFDLVFTDGAFILSGPDGSSCRVVSLNNILLINPSDFFPTRDIYQWDEEKTWKRIFSLVTLQEREAFEELDWSVGTGLMKETWRCLAHTYTQSCAYFSLILSLLELHVSWRSVHNILHSEHVICTRTCMTTHYRLVMQKIDD